MENENQFYGITDIGQAEDILNHYMRDYPNDINGTEQLLSNLLEALFASKDSLTGEADDFHNFSVSVVRITNSNRNAARIIEAGLAIHGKNTDLLADAIHYQYNCGDKEACTEYFQLLRSVDRSMWTWRAFSFTIKYLLNNYVSSGESNYTIDEILELAKEYQKMIPSEEDAWICEYQIYNRTNQREKGIHALEEALEHFDFCPRCWLRYADIMIEQGDYDKAHIYIKKLKGNPKAAESVNTAYVNFLDGQCKMYALINSTGYDEGEIDSKQVIRVYLAFRLALSSSELRDDTKRQIDEYINRLELETGIKYPDDWRL